MPKNLAISVDEYLSRRSLVSKDGMVYRAAKMPKSFDAESRSATFVMTDETIDSYGDIVRAKGCKLDRFENNPICLLNHRSDQILGTWSDVKRIVRRIEGKCTLANEGTAPHIDMAYNLMSQGILRAASIGFMPIKVERRLDENGEPMWAYDILEWEMYECSVVSIPANPSALAKSMKDGCMLARDLLEQVLDTYVKMPSGLIVAMADVEAAHKDGGGNKTIATGVQPVGRFQKAVDAIMSREKGLGLIVDKALLPARKEFAPVAGEAMIELSATTAAEADIYTGATVKLKADHEENAGWPFDVIKDAHGEVIASWIVEEDANKGVHALAVEFLTNDFKGMFRGIKAERFVLVHDHVETTPDTEAKDADEVISDAELLAGLEGIGKALLNEEIRAAFAAQIKQTDLVVIRDQDGEVKLVAERATDDDIIDAAELVLPSDMTIADVQALQADIIQRVAAAAEPELQVKTTEIVVNIDTDDATAKVNALSALVDSVTAKIAKFFGPKAAETEPVNLPEPPTPEAIEAARAKATDTLARLASKGLIEA